MPEPNNIDPHVCNAGVPETTVEVAPAADIRPGDTDDVPLETGEAAKNSKRRASFAAPGPATDKKRTSGGLDSLGKGRLP
ncbi:MULTISPECIES: hypothetical protein [Pseudomonas]|uniref:Uncharacterized protein n=1 Tax=Pseudomonas izuensis TaxID=2684212 RepID=A0ABM7RP43_9PSED|nr:MULTISPECIES: hypothetical protein [Pseudomonas]RKS28742.1 hypothetical protein BJ917_1641 [Pseudomonas sp. WPR_5_2]BCX67019.1 hypothetical protein LAB08_R16430 [Pseudomonas izuensis]